MGRKIPKRIISLALFLAMLFPMAAALAAEDVTTDADSTDIYSSETVSESETEANADTETDLVYDLDGLLVSDSGEDDMNSWRYEDGEPIEVETEDSNNGIMIVSTTSSDSVAFGVDVSKWQGDIDWDSARGSISFAIIRCGYGSNLTANDDAYFEQNVEACEELGIPYGVYLYSYATTTTEAKSEANHALRLLKGHTPSLPVYLDLEDSSITSACSNSQILAMAKIFCNAIENAGYEAGIYANKNWWTNYLTSSTYDQWDRWVAQWSSSCTYSGSYTYWQYTDSGSVSGISGAVDCNYAMSSSPFYSSSTPKIANANLPSGSLSATTYSISGIVSSSKKITSLTVSILDSSGTTVQTVTVKPNGKSYELASANFIIDMADLERGATYTCQVKAKTSSGTYTVKETTFSHSLVFVNGSLYTGYYLNSDGLMYKVTKGVLKVYTGGLAKGTSYYNASSGKSSTTTVGQMYVEGSVYAGYYMTTKDVLYYATSSSYSKYTGFVSTGTSYFDASDHKTYSTEADAFYEDGSLYTGYYLGSDGLLYKVTDGALKVYTGGLAKGTAYYTSSGTSSTTTAGQMYVKGSVYTGYYMTTKDVLYYATSSSYSKYTGFVSTGTSYFDASDHKTYSTEADAFYEDGSLYTGYYLGSDGLLYKVTDGALKVYTGGLAKSTAYYTSSGKSSATTVGQMYVEGSVYTGYYLTTKDVLYYATSSSYGKYTGLVSAGTSYFDASDHMTYSTEADAFYADGSLYASGYCLGSDGLMYKVTDGALKVYTGGLAKGTSYYTSSGKSSTTTVGQMYVKGSVYTGYYMTTKDVLYYATSSSYSKYTGLVSAGTSYFDASDHMTYSTEADAFYADGSLYTSGYCLGSDGLMYKVTAGALKAYTGGLAKGTAYYTSSGKSSTTTAGQMYVKGSVYTGYYMTTKDVLYYATSSSYSKYTGLVSAGTSYFDASDHKTYKTTKSGTYVNGVLSSQ